MLWACILLPASEAAHWRDLLAAWAYRYSSQVATCFDNAVVLEIAASLRAVAIRPSREQVAPVRGFAGRQQDAGPEHRGLSACQLPAAASAMRAPADCRHGT